MRLTLSLSSKCHNVTIGAKLILIYDVEKHTQQQTHNYKIYTNNQSRWYTYDLAYEKMT